MCAYKEGSAPQAPGAAILIRDDRSTVGTLGGGCVEAELVRRSYKEALPVDQSTLIDIRLTHDCPRGWDDGLICGGRMGIGMVTVGPKTDLTAFRQAIEGAAQRRPGYVPIRVAHEGNVLEYRISLDVSPVLLIAGAGHIGQALARLAVDLDFHVVVVDDRQEYASPQRFGPDVKLITRDIAAALEAYPIDSNCYVVIVTRGHMHDQQALEAVLNRPAKYIGMIGSKRKIKLVFDKMQQKGFASERLNEIHTPIGLPIGAVTVTEIAVSITAELIKVRRQTVEKLVEGPFEVGQSPPA
jgi:xanthine dehydrogenase accessory factor